MLIGFLYSTHELLIISIVLLVVTYFNSRKVYYRWVLPFVKFYMIIMYGMPVCYLFAKHKYTMRCQSMVMIIENETRLEVYIPLFFL